MGKLAFMQFYPSDWIRDTRVLGLAARGAWIDILCILWESETRGTKTQDMDGWAAELGKGITEIKAALDEIHKRKIGTVETLGNGEVTVSSRRMMREEIERESTRKRVARFRAAPRNGACNGEVTRRIQNPESRIQKEECLSTAGDNSEKEDDRETQGKGLTAIAGGLKELFEAKAREAEVQEAKTT